MEGNEHEMSFKPELAEGATTVRQGALTAGWLQREGQITCQVNRVGIWWKVGEK